jgi:hypothetical protein
MDECGDVDDIERFRDDGLNLVESWDSWGTRAMCSRMIRLGEQRDAELGVAKRGAATARFLDSLP